MKVYVITCCRDESLLYGSTLVFDTLRVGFPTASVEVVDNGSPEALAERIKTTALARIGSGLVTWRHGQFGEHPDVIRMIVEENRDSYDPIVILDPDVIFWSNCEGWVVDGLYGGAVEQRHRRYGAITQERIHTSFLWIPDPSRLCRTIDDIGSQTWNFRPYHGMLWHDGAAWRFVDTLGGLYSVVKNEVQPFGPQQLDAYSHVQCGSSLDIVKKLLPTRTRRFIEGVHEAARTNPASLRGLWRRQAEFYRETERATEVSMHLRWARGDQHAANLMTALGYYVQKTDDVVDGHPGLADPIELSAATCEILIGKFSDIECNPFYARYASVLRPMIIMAINEWHASNWMTQASDPETQMHAYVRRNATGRVIEMIAFLVGGFQWMAQVTKEFHHYYHGDGGVECFDDWRREHHG